MDWSNEPYVRVYTRETDDDLALSWEARALWKEMLCKFDRSGVIETKRAAKGLAAVVKMPPEVVARVLPELLEDGRLREIPTGYFAPNFIEAQEAKKSDKLRQKESRDRRRQRNLDLPVTNRDEAVTIRDETSRGVTLCSADPDPDPLLRTAPARARARAIPDTGADKEPEPQRDPSADLPPRLTSVPARSRDDLRRKLWNEAWTFAGLEHVKLKSEGVDRHARNCWSGVPPADSPEAKLLFARIDELLVTDDYETAREKIRNRVLVAAEQARHKHGHLQFFTPMRMWDPKSFAIDVALSPQQVASTRESRASRDEAEPLRRIETLD